MQITFRNNKLQKNCSQEKKAVKAYGEKCARKLMRRLMELNATDTLSQIPRVPPPRCHELTGNRKGTLSVDLEHPWRLLFIPANSPIPKKKDGGLDWERVTAIEITSIEDYH